MTTSKQTLYINVDQATVSDRDEEEFNDKVIRLSFNVSKDESVVALRQTRSDALARIFTAMLVDSFVLLRHLDVYAVQPNSAFSHEHFDFLEIKGDDGGKVLTPSGVLAPLICTMRSAFSVWKARLTTDSRETDPKKRALFLKAAEAVRRVSAEENEYDALLFDYFEEYVEQQDDADIHDFSTQSRKLLRFGGGEDEIRNLVGLMQNSSLLTSVSLYRPVCSAARFRSVVVQCKNILHLNLDLERILEPQDCVDCVSQFLLEPFCKLVSLTLNLPRTTRWWLFRLADAIRENKTIKSFALRNVVFDQRNYNALLDAMFRNFTLTKIIVVPSRHQWTIPAQGRCLSAIAPELAFRNSHDLAPKNVHRRLLDFCLLFFSMYKQIEWPPYVLLEIFDWFPPSRNIEGVPCCSIMQQVDHGKKIEWINQVFDTVKKLRCEEIKQEK